MGEQELCSRFVNLFLEKLDPHASWFSPDLLLDFEIRHVIRYSTGFSREQIDGEWQITGFSDRLAGKVDPSVAQRVKGMQLLAVRSGDAEIVFTGNSDHKVWRDIVYGEFLGDVDKVVLELRDPETLRRMDIEWPRFRWVTR